MIAVVLGATGLVGKELLKKLLEDSSYHSVISVSRATIGRNEPRLKEIIIQSLEEVESIGDGLKGDLYFCCLGTTLKAAGSKTKFKKVDYDGVMAFAKVAHINQCRAFLVVTAQGASTNSYFFYSQVKGKVEQDLMGMNFKRLIIFRPSLLIGDRQESRLLEGLGQACFKMMSSLVPKFYLRRLGTVAEDLASKMIEKSKEEGPKVEILLAQDI